MLTLVNLSEGSESFIVLFFFVQCFRFEIFSNAKLGKEVKARKDP